MKKQYEEVFGEAARSLEKVISVVRVAHGINDLGADISIHSESDGEFSVEFLQYPDKTGVPVKYQYILYPDAKTAQEV